MGFSIKRTQGNVYPKSNLSAQNLRLDTHYYDGKLVTNELVQTVYDQQKCDIQTKALLFTRLIQDIQQCTIVLDQYRSTAIQAVNLIKENIHKASNYDNTNGMYADDVLYLVCTKMYDTKNMDVLKYLSEQLSDIITFGQCAQGRSTRIFQVLITL